jgi:hypothetical protein
MSVEPLRPVLIGWKERIDLPDFHLRRIPAKIDTGARTSALSAAYYVLREDADGQCVAELTLEFRRPRRGPIRVLVPVLGMATVKCTGGIRETRPIIETRIRLGPILKKVRFTVTDRSHMLTPLILGRQALAEDFIVDVNRKYALRRTRATGD